MDALKCSICETPRTFEETIKYPDVEPVIISPVSTEMKQMPVDDDKMMKNGQNEQNEQNGQNGQNQTEQKEDEYVMVDHDDGQSPMAIDGVEHKENEKNSAQQTLTYLTWNVWFNEELEVIQRMKAIGEHIQKYDADIVCLQEVTSTILDILQQSPWYSNGGYSSTILPAHGQFALCTYFNVIMTKHEMIRDSIRFIPFENSVMGRHLIVCPIKIGDTVVWAATSHLESPVGPHMGGKEDWFSAERKEQLKFSMMILDERRYCDSNNVVFGGDMNWRKPSKNGKNENDGNMKQYLRANWSDCYETLHPNDDGFTYDAKENGMLLGYLRNRLDRVLYKTNGNLKLKSCEMIGKEAIPNVSYIKETKRKGNVEHKRLPVLPSDHFGLCAKFDFV